MKATYKKGNILKIKENSDIIFENIWNSQKYPYAKVYDVRKVFRKNQHVGFEYHIGSENKIQFEYWDSCRFVDFYEKVETFQHINNKIQDHFYTNKEMRKMKLEKLNF